MPTDTWNFSLTILLLLFPFSANAQFSNSERDLIGYAKTLDIATLDPSLSSQRLEDWLRSGPPHLDRVSWGVSPNCDRKPANNEIYSELPLCIKIYYERDGVRGESTISIGTIGKGIQGPPHLLDVSVDPRGEPEERGGGDSYISDRSPRLSDLPLFLEEVSFTVQHKEVIRYTQALDVATLDPALSSQRLEDWLRFGPAHSHKLAWGVRFDCGASLDKSSMPANGSPLCVTVVFNQGDISRWATVEIGTIGKGPSGSPSLKSIAVQPMLKDERASLTSNKLSDLPRLMDEARHGQR